MPRKSLAPASIDVLYTTTIGTITFNHHMTVPVNVLVWNGLLTNVVVKDGSNVVWTTAITSLLTTLTPMYHTSSVFVSAELWRQDTATSDPVLIATFAFPGITGASATNTTLGLGMCYAFRSSEDSPYRLIAIEAAKLSDQRKAYSNLTAAEKAPVDYLLGNTSLVYARSNAYLSTFGIWTTKVYDAVRKKRLGM